MTRTHDLLITNQLLYRLSYISIFTFRVADLILTNQLLYRLSYTSIFCEKMTAAVTSITAVAMIAYFPASVNLFFGGTCDFPAEHGNNTRRIAAGGTGLRKFGVLPSLQTAFDTFFLRAPEDRPGNLQNPWIFAQVRSFFLFT